MTTSAAARPRPGGAQRGEELKHYLRQMLLIRRFEEKAGEAYSLGKIGGFCHLYIGQEAVAVGTIAALRPDDYLISAYREHGQRHARTDLGQCADTGIPHTRLRRGTEHGVEHQIVETAAAGGLVSFLG